MIFWKNNNWHLCSEKVRYTQHGEGITQLIGSEGHDWWVRFEEKWEHTEIVEFISIEHTEVQATRFEDVSQLNVPDGFGAELGEYVESGTFPDGFNHILRPLQILKQQEEQDEYLIDLDFRQTLNEMGVDISDVYSMQEID